MLTETERIELDNFISKTAPAELSDMMVGISHYDLQNGKYLFCEMKKIYPAGYYEIFASYGLGNSNYALYKSANGIIYFIYQGFTSFIKYAIVPDDSPNFN